jgi:hypothetical protein
MTREAWLLALAAKVRPALESAGATVPAEVRLSCGWPSHGATAARNRVLGQCWHAQCSADGTREVFISPTLADAVEVAHVVEHELIHAAGFMGHAADFKRVAVALGLTGKMTATVPTDAHHAELAVLVADLGAYPHATLTPDDSRKQSTRLLKAMCGECGYTIRVTAKWADIGLPMCPCGTWMERV